MIYDLLSQQLSCTLFVYFDSVSMSLSAYIILAFTIERFVALDRQPRWPQSTFTAITAIKIVAGISVVTTVYKLYIIVVYASNNSSIGMEGCNVMNMLSSAYLPMQMY